MAVEQNVARALDLLDKVSKIYASAQSFVGDITLNKLELLALDFIFKKGEITMSELAKGLGISLSTATGIIDRLVDKDLVSRKRNHGDRRVVRVMVTRKGGKAASDYRKHKSETIKKMMTLLTPDEQRSFISIWEKIAGAWDE